MHPFPPLESCPGLLNVALGAESDSSGLTKKPGLTVFGGTANFRPPSGDRRTDGRTTAVSQGSGRSRWSRTTRPGSRVASGGSPRPLRKEAGSCGEWSPVALVPSEPLVALAVLIATLAHAAAAPTKTKKKVRPPKIHETVGDLAYVVSNGEMRVEGVGLVTGLDNTGGDSPPSHYPQDPGRRDDQGGGGAPRAAAGQPAVLDRARADDDPDGRRSRPTRSTSRWRCRRTAPPRAWPAATCSTTRLFRVSYGNKGEALRDHELAIARGPIMLGTPAKPNDPKVGRVLGRRTGQEGVPVYPRHQGEPRELLHGQDARDGHQPAVPPVRGRAPEGGRRPGRPPASWCCAVPELYHQNQARYLPGRPVACR